MIYSGINNAIDQALFYGGKTERHVEVIKFLADLMADKKIGELVTIEMLFTYNMLPHWADEEIKNLTNSGERVTLIVENCGEVIFTLDFGGKYAILDYPPDCDFGGAFCCLTEGVEKARENHKIDFPIVGYCDTINQALSIIEERNQK